MAHETPVEHLILEVLFKYSRMIATQTGIAVEGMKLLSKDIRVSPMHFGAIVGLVNFPNASFNKPPFGHINYFIELNPTDKDLIAEGDFKYSNSVIADCIDNLVLNDHIEDNFTDIGDDRTIRTITLTMKGKVAYTTKYWIKYYEKEQLSIRQLETSISLSGWSKCNIAIGLLIGFSTLFVAGTNLYLTIERDKQEGLKATPDTTEQRQIKESVLELKKKLHQISLSLSDTSIKR